VERRAFWRNIVRQMNDSQLVATLRSDSTEELVTRWRRTASAVSEIFRRGERIIPLLAGLRGDRSIFCGGWSGDSTSLRKAASSWALHCSGEGAIPLEQAALFYIVAIYRGSLDFTNSMDLKDDHKPLEWETMTSRDFSERAWLAVDRWLVYLRRDGLEGVRNERRGPLDGSGLSFF